MKKVIVGILYVILSVIWLFLAVVFTSTLWLTSPGTNDWTEDAMFIPIGIVMGILWAVSLVFLMIKIKGRKH